MWLWAKSIHGGDKHRINGLAGSSSVEQVRRLVAEAFGVMIDTFRIFHKGKSLEDGHKLFDYNVQNDDVLQIFLRLPEAGAAAPAEASKPVRYDFDGTFAVVIPARRSTSGQSITNNNATGVRGSEGGRVDSNSSEIVPANNSPNLPDSIASEFQNLNLMLDETEGPEACDTCDNDPNGVCNQCGCFICAGKDDPDHLLYCEECNYFFHMRCQNPPLTEIPEGDFFCSECKNSTDHIVGVGQRLDLSKSKKSKQASATQTKSWGGGNACRARAKECTRVDDTHVGPIPGIEVGQSWFYRIELSESGVHRPPVGGISGGVNTGSFSIVLSGGYPEDIDYGDRFLYTGSGGRDLATGNKRTAPQDADQQLTKFNKALAMTIHGGFVPTDKEVVAKDWRKSRAIRVCRGAKLAKLHPTYAPTKGVRYDGIYKLVRYWTEKGDNGFKCIRYEFRRDDPAPPPWTTEGKKKIKKLGLEMIYPVNHDHNAVKEKNPKGKKRSLEEDEIAPASGSEPEVKKPAKEWKVPQALKSLMNKDTANHRLWNSILYTNPIKNQLEYMDKLDQDFKCPICLDFIQDPVTLRCSHNACLGCMHTMANYGTVECPHCRMLLLPHWKEATEEDKKRSEADKQKEASERAAEWKACAKVNMKAVAVVRFFNPNYGKKVGKGKGIVVEEEEDQEMEDELA